MSLAPFNRLDGSLKRGQPKEYFLDYKFPRTVKINGFDWLRLGRIMAR
jgi:hypothetical protein